MQELSIFKNKKPVIAIDGTAGSGKGELAKKLSKILGFDHLDSGILYRIFAYEFLIQGVELKNLKSIKIDFDLFLRKNYSATNLRSEEVSKFASIIAKESFVREKLVSVQRNFANSPPSGQGSVIDGRDITTKITPNAEIKFYLDADINIRAKRRQMQLGLDDKDYDEILRMMISRDNQDKNRKISPLKKTEDSLFIDTTNITEVDVLNLAIKYIKEKTDFI